MAKGMAGILSVVLAVFYISCGSTNSKVQTTAGSEHSIIKDSTAVMHKNKQENKDTYPEVFLFKYTECNENCHDDERIISREHKGDTLWLKTGSIQNCTGKFRLDLEKNENILNLNIKVKEELVKHKNGKVDTILIISDCECYYYFDIGIIHVDKDFKTILINGRKPGRKPRGQAGIIK